MNATFLSMMPRRARNHLVWQQPLAEALTALSECTQVCLACADACLVEEHPDHLRRCIRLNLNCATICHAMAQVLHRQAELTGALVRDLLRACISACHECTEECRRHAAQHEHCRICSTTCLRCHELCNQLLGTLTPAGAAV